MKVFAGRLNERQASALIAAAFIFLEGINFVPRFDQIPKPVPPLRKQAAIQQEWLKLRLERVLPTLMRRYGVQMWLVICREYNEDPVFFSLVSATQFAARRRTIYVFFDRGEKDGVERLALGGGAQGGLYTVYRDPKSRIACGSRPMGLLRKLIEERQPKPSPSTFPHACFFGRAFSRRV
jgi:hypothetical protein